MRPNQLNYFIWNVKLMNSSESGTNGFLGNAFIMNKMKKYYSNSIVILLFNAMYFTYIPY